MTYPDVSPDFLEKLLNKKEFYSLRVTDKDFRFPEEDNAGYMRPRTYQLFVKNFINPNTNYTRMHLMHGCHSKNTVITMANGLPKYIQNVAIGDEVMGDDMTSRKVLALWRGRDQMYKVRTTNKEFECNHGHILTLSTHGGVIDVSLADVLQDNLLRQSHCIVNGRCLNYERFTITKLTVGEYYGFELDGNHRYMANDIVTHNTGVGKTMAAVLVANEFKKAYKRILVDELTRRTQRKADILAAEKITPNIFVFGFGATKAAFYRELLRYPELGFITAEEKKELETKRSSANLSDANMLAYNDLYKRIKKRVTSKGSDGFFVFYGYEEFVNRIFHSNKISLAEIEHKIMKSATGNLEESIMAYIKSGEIQVNTELLKTFENSLIICDEIHNTYNSLIKNNRGVAIQYVLNSVTSVRFLSMSATPVNNSPTEIVELMNYLCSTVTHKRDLFDANGRLLDGALKVIGQRLYGRVSFLQDTNIKYFPEKILCGATLKLANVAVPYLKFFPCKMSEMHMANVREVLSEKNVLPSDSYVLYDMVYPSPDGRGLYKAHEIRQTVNDAPQDWKDTHGIYVKKIGNNYAISGSFLSRKNVAKYSAKYAAVMGDVCSIYKSTGGDYTKGQKIMIYHNRIKLSGVLTIQELLLTNGILDEVSDPNDGTLCSCCGDTMAGHNGGPIPAHAFVPARFVIIHSDIDVLTRTNSMDKYNAPENTYGTKYSILVGSKLIKESYDFKSVRQLLICSMPTNIPTLIQIIGRCVRNRSHNDLPPEHRKVNIKIFVSTESAAGDDEGHFSIELRKYSGKLADYKIIQQIEKKITEVAVDANIHRAITMPVAIADTLKEPGLGYLYFDPPPMTFGTPDDSTFISNKYFSEEIALISYIIKKLYQIQPVYTFDTLWANVKSPPFGLETNPAMFSEDNFIIALDNIVKSTPIRPDGEYILVNGTKHNIKHIDKYYVLFPVDATARSVDFDAFIRPRTYQPPLKISNVLMRPNTSAIDKRFLLTLQPDEVAKAYLFLPQASQETILREILFTNELKPVINTLAAMDVLIRAKEIKKYADIIRQFKSILAVADDAYIGYCTDHNISIYHDNTWVLVKRTAINRQSLTRENDTTVAIIDNGTLKLRRPLPNKIINDARLIEKGMACSAKSKSFLVYILKKLGVSTADINDKKVSLCRLLFDQLLAMEIKERASNGKLKYIYFWFDAQPKVAVI